MPEHTDDPDLPPPSAELVFIRVLVEAHLETLSRKKGELFLMTVASKLADEDNLGRVFNIRPSSQDKAVATARRQASLIAKRLMPVFLARLGGPRY